MPYLTKFDGHIRSLDSDSRDLRLRSQLASIFPTFFDTPQPEVRINPETFQPQVRHRGVQRPPRRFAGHHDQVTFPRGRYYSVAHDAKGNDRSTLARELLAYSCTSLNGRIVIADAGQPEDVELLRAKGIEPVSRDSLIVLLDWNNPTPSVAIEIPLRTHKVTIRNCVDLRHLRTQEWFYHEFRHGNDQLLLVPGAETGALGFVDMLPGLIWPSLGGGSVDEPGSITRAIGSWLRTKGVSALVFPSARCDAFVRYELGTLVDFYGWNLVDYRETWDDTNLIGCDPIRTANMSGWPNGLPYPCEIRVDSEGSWRIVGAEEYLLRRFGL